VKAFALGNVVGLMFAGAVAAIAILTPDTNRADKLAKATREGDMQAAFIEYMKAPMRIPRW